MKPKKPPFYRRVLLRTILLVLSVQLTSTSAQEYEHVAAGASIQKRIAAGELHRYQLGLGAGQFLQIAVEERNIDVRMALSGPDNARGEAVALNNIGFAHFSSGDHEKALEFYLLALSRNRESNFRRGEVTNLIKFLPICPTSKTVRGVVNVIKKPAVAQYFALFDINYLATIGG